MDVFKGRQAVVVCTFLLAAAAGCGRNAQTDVFDTIYYEPEYAEGFEIAGMRDSLSRVLRTVHSWQGDDGAATEIFIARGGERPPESFTGQVMEGSAERVVAMSSSHIAMIDLVGETARVKAVSGLEFISNSHIREHSGEIADIGSEAGADFEKLAAVRPDVVLLYGITSSSPMEGRLRELGIPFVYIGEYLEKIPLGRAEWMVAIAEILGCREKGEAEFGKIKERYDSLAGFMRQYLAGTEGGVRTRPTVMLNAPYGDIWYMPPAESAMARLIKDAGAEYIYRENHTDKSLPIDFEKAFLLVSEADFWLNPGQFATIRELTGRYPEFAETGCVLEKKVYNCNRRVNSGGGNDFWESGPARPDLVLGDLMKIFHPELACGKEAALENGQERTGDGPGSPDGDDGLYYYMKLE